LYIRDQAAYSHQSHEVDATKPITATKRMKTDSPPDTKYAEQSDEDVLRQESVKKGKKKFIGERQKAH